MAVKVDLMGVLSCTFSDLFAEPSGLPPQWDRCHEIRLLLGTPPVDVCPYRYAYAQKQELECQCTKMLQTGVI
jgi:hypothetical protein